MNTDMKDTLLLAHVGGVSTLDEEIKSAFTSGTIKDYQGAFDWTNAGEYANMPDAERLERFLLGDPNLGMHNPAHIPVSKLNTALYPFIESDRDRSEVNPEYEEETNLRATFFYYGESFEELKTYIDNLLIQPTSESAEARIQASANEEIDEMGNLLTRESGDAYGDNKLTITFFEIPREKFDTFCKNGIAFAGHGKYTTPNGEECLTKECCFSDRGLEQIRDYVIIHGSLPNILKDESLFGYTAGYEGEKYNTEARKYTPLFTKMPEKESTTTTGISKKDQDEMTAWLENLKASGASPAELAMYEQAMKDTIAHYSKLSKDEMGEDE